MNYDIARPDSAYHSVFTLHVPVHGAPVSLSGGRRKDMKLEKFVLPNRDDFGRDPFGYSALAWHKWGVASTLAGFPVDLSRPPTSQDLKNPVLWLTQAHAMSEAAKILIQNQPELSHLPNSLKGLCDCQYCAVALMLIGYSLEICLKGMLIIKKGIDVYESEKKKHQHHRIEKLAEFLPDLSAKDKAILQILTHFVLWAGRYPDPGSGREGNAEEIFRVSEKHQIAAKDLFRLAARVMGYAKQVSESL